MKHGKTASLVRETVDPPWDELRALRVEKRVMEELRATKAVPASTSRGRAVRVIAMVGALAVAAVALFFVFRGGPTDPIAISAGRLDLEDGSVALLEDGARVMPVTVTDSLVELRQVQGAATYDVVPGRGRKFSVLIGDARVDVLGTSFRVDKLDDGLHVSVLRGKVQVTRGGRTAELSAGENLTWRGEEGPASPLPSAAEAAIAREPPPEETPLPEASAKPTPSASPKVELKILPAPLDPSATPIAPPSADSEAARLFREADDARGAGDVGRAISLLEKLIADHPTDTRVTLATFTIGRLELQLGHAARAAKAFESCGLALGGEALAEAAGARAKAGEPAAARRLALQYLESFPAGARAKEMKRLAP